MRTTDFVAKIISILFYIAIVSLPSTLALGSVETSEKAVVSLTAMVNGEKNGGTGFFFTSSGLILTNQHVVGDVGNEVAVETFNRKKYLGEVLHADRDRDLAVVLVDSKTNSHPFLQLSDSTEAERLDNIYLIGHPSILVRGVPTKQFWALETGNITGINKPDGFFKLNIETYGGNSGGPAISPDTGLVMGVVASHHPEADNYTFAIKSDVVLNWLSSLQIPLPSHSSTSEPESKKLQVTNERFEFGIATGRAGGTYKAMGDDIVDLVDPYGIDLNVISDEPTDEDGNKQPTTTGSIRNIFLVDTDKCCKAGMVQTDVLHFLLRDEKNKRLIDRVRFLLPLHPEQVHLIARKDINSIDELKKGNRLIAVDNDNTGTFLTATTLLSAIGVNSDTYVRKGAEHALELLTLGKIDAMIYVGGYPVNLLKKGIPADLHMLDIDPSDIAPLPVGKNEIYQPTKIPGNAYSWLNRDVSTISVRAVLMTFNYKEKDCRGVRRMLNILKESYKTLALKNPQRWDSVNFSLPAPRGWKTFQPDECN